MLTNENRISYRAGLAALTLLLAACDSGSTANVSPPPLVTYQYAVPAQNGDGWTTGHLNDHGFSTAIVIDMMQRIVDGQFAGIDSVLIVRNNTLVLYSPLRENFDEFDDLIGNQNLERHVLFSTSKSVTSALVGIAIDLGYITSTQANFYGMFSYGLYDNWDTRKSETTLEDALTMRLGIAWDEWSVPYGEAGNDHYDLTTNSMDYSKALLDLPVESDPGTTYAYNTVATIAIGQALEDTVGTSMIVFANTHLFFPMQITNAEWALTPTGLANGGSGLFLEPRDMAKFGQMYIAEGVWNGQQVVSANWIRTSVQRHVSVSWDGTSGYGYQWWLDDFQFEGQPIASWSTRGYGGQYIFCVPALNLVVTFTGRNYGTSGAQRPFALMQDFILPSLSDAG